jgi:hypothetical protein
MRLSHKRLIITVLIFTLFVLALSAQTIKPVNAQSTADTSAAPVHVQVGVWLNNVEKVDTAANTYRLDFYLWFSFNPSQISLDEIKQFEFVNGAPTKYEVDSNDSYLEYRVKGDFLTAFDFSRYPFDSHLLPVQLEHNNYDVSHLIYEPDPTSNKEPISNVAGWTLSNFQTDVTEHAYSDQSFSRYIFSVTIDRPFTSSFIKTVLPISVITAISMLAFFMAPQNFAMRITLAVTTLLAATTFHLSLLSGIPTAGYLTIADRMMIGVYALFLYNLASSVFIMRQVDTKNLETALQTRSKALKFLPIMIAAVIILVVLL